jgi:hypothetical protein
MTCLFYWKQSIELSTSLPSAGAFSRYDKTSMLEYICHPSFSISAKTILLL